MRLFQNWEEAQGSATEAGFPDVGVTNPEYLRNVSAMIKQSIKVLGTCIVEAPEIKRTRAHDAGKAAH